MFSDGVADWLDGVADEHQETEEELAFIRVWEERRENAIMYGTPISSFKPTDTMWRIIQWILKHGEVKSTIPLAEGRMTTRQEIVDTDSGMYYLKTGWYNKDKVSVHTMTPDQFVLDLVSKEITYGKAK